MNRQSRNSTGDSRNARMSRNSTGAKEGEFMGPRTDLILPEETPQGQKEKDGRALIIAFCAMVLVGLGNKVFNKLMTIPMHNYPNFLNLLTSFVYIPVCFAYIIPMAYYGHIPSEQFEVPKKTIAIMGTLDALAGIMQIFGATYLPGPLIILLLQAAIPVSMIISRYLVNAQYDRYQYGGAVIVAGGILIVLGPSLTGGGDIVWSIVLILSTIPMALSSVYKEIALGETELDAIYLNGWVAVFQFFFSLVLAVPSSLASDPPVPISDLPQNMWNGMKCYVGISSYTCDADANDDSCTADKCFPQAPEFVNIYLVFNQFYNLLIILILKYGSSNLLYLALTLMVPLGNVVFTLPFVPENSPLRVTDIVGLVVICFGLGCYRFASKLIAHYFGDKVTVEKPYDTLENADSKLFSNLLVTEDEDRELSMN